LERIGNGLPMNFFEISSTKVSTSSPVRLVALLLAPGIQLESKPARRAR